MQHSVTTRLEEDGGDLRKFVEGLQRSGETPAAVPIGEKALDGPDASFLQMLARLIELLGYMPLAPEAPEPLATALEEAA